ncbi:MAG: hypothetical protein HETSPECPRED_009916 [Heterodermia speciosa]|uniref:Uncharacterized protein n=1 Tax=Heterodermia speciosa TaxID=116794 RepID=A0A8H3G3C9_9LECA|nr:MAG: hypothetical protein HETSPECPRED_009916 [Heterodermia speciosa]
MLEDLPDDLSEVVVDEMFVEAVDRPGADGLKNDAALDDFVRAVEKIESVLERFALEVVPVNNDAALDDFVKAFEKLEPVLERFALEMVPVKIPFAVDDELEEENGIDDDRLLDILLGDCEV